VSEQADALKLAFLIELLDQQHKRRREFFSLARISDDWMYVEGTQLDISANLKRSWIRAGWIDTQRVGDRMRCMILAEGRDAARRAAKQHGKTAK